MANSFKLEIGSKFTHIFNGLNRKKLKTYSKLGLNPNPIHYDDKIAKREGLKEANAQYLYPIGFVFKVFMKFLQDKKSFNIIELGINQQSLRFSKNHLFYKNYWRCQELLLTEAVLKKIEGKNLHFEITQSVVSSIENLDSNDDSIMKTKIENGIIANEKKNLFNGYIIISI